YQSTNILMEKERERGGREREGGRAAVIISHSRLSFLLFYCRKTTCFQNASAISQTSRSKPLATQVRKVLLFFYLPVYPCGAKSREWKYFDGACYFFSIQEVIWHTAENHCQEKNSELVVITNQYEQNFLQSQIRNERYWIGLSDHNDEGQWRWIDGTDYRTSFKNWVEGEPNDHSHNEDCAELSQSGKWNDVSCNTKKVYVCKKPLSS
uniref:C-type lectin domain-containing protein n=1 Tax=Laticauda laticaudata TaxID=8630 RepID=A0A8C5RVB0_LATLA